MRRTATLLFLTAFLPACDFDLEKALVEDFPECPHSWERVAIYDPEVGSVTTVSPPLAGPGATRDIPEYHDCQRFVVRDSLGLRYDSLFAVFRTDTVAATPNGPATPMAEILAWGSYDPLGIERGTNCLYMWRVQDPPGAPEWRASMVHVADWGGSSPLDCASEIQPRDLPDQFDLDVNETHRGLAVSAFPDVARWGWRPNETVQTVQLRCGAAWCEVLPAGASPSPSYHDMLVSDGSPPPDGTPSAVLNRYRVSGWYDEQVLAFDPDPTDPTNDLVPTEIVGRFFPHVDLGNKGVGDFRPSPGQDPWTLVGYIALEAPATVNPVHVAKYEDTYGMQRTDPYAHFEEMNRLFHCQGSKTECGVPADVDPCTEDDEDEDLEWWGRVLAPDGSQRIHCVTRRGHEDVASMLPDGVPATARWRWAVNDEGTWDRCIQGCCEMVGGAF